MPDYFPGTVPQTPNPELDLFLAQELQRLSGELSQFKSTHYVEWAEVPEKYTRGDVYFFAAGIVGLVEGFYWYNGTAWQPLGRYPPARGGLYRNTAGAQVINAADTKLTIYNTLAPPVDVTGSIAAGTLTIDRAGFYVAHVVVNFINPAPNQTYQLMFYKNGAVAPVTRATYTAKDNNDGVSLQSIIAADLVAGDVIDTRMNVSGGPHNLSFSTALFQLVQQQ